MINDKIKKIIYDNNYEFIHIKSTTSTMIEVKNYLSQNNKNCIFLSDLQIKGRGQRGNLWVIYLKSLNGIMYTQAVYDNMMKKLNNDRENIQKKIEEQTKKIEELKKKIPAT